MLQIFEVHVEVKRTVGQQTSCTGTATYGASVGTKNIMLMQKTLRHNSQESQRDRNSYSSQPPICKVPAEHCVFMTFRLESNGTCNSLQYSIFKH